MPRGMLGGLAALAATIAIALLAPAGAGAYVYWANTATGVIGRAGNEGTPVEPEFIRGLAGPNAVAVDSGHIYWSDYTKMAIGRATLSGTVVEPEWLKLPYQPNGVAVSATNVYWTAGGPGFIGRAGIDGGSPSFEFVKGVGGVCGLALDSGHLYSVTGNSGPGLVLRVGLDGKNLEGEFVTVPEVTLLCGVAVNSASVFWTDVGLGAGTNIGRASLTNPKSGLDPSYIGAASGPCGITVFGSKLYWANSGTSTIGRANTDASGVEYEFIHTGAEPKKICGVAVDNLSPPPGLPPGSGGSAKDTTPPQTKLKSGPGKKLAEGIAQFKFASSEPGSSFECKLDGKKKKRCSSPKRYSGLKAGHHTFKVWALDAAGNRDPSPAVRGFRVPAG